MEEKYVAEKKERKLISKISASADGGPRSRSAHARPSAQLPIDSSRIFSAILFVVT